jgi:acyl transferase domain-containing protein/NAD(P)H-dependent flavin oxidoreductase YrpB (nitropropane dioxygenase family)/NAD(P)-dependent dehydrogenase (short-subunit alcohol dehydrogenase family)
MQEFQLIALTPLGSTDPSIAIATSRAGELGVLNLEHVQDDAAAYDAIARMTRYARRAWGIKLDSSASAFIERVTSDLPGQVEAIILTLWEPGALRQRVADLRKRRLTVLLEVTDLKQAQLGEALGVDGLIAKGHEAGGWVGEETTFILLQRLLAHVSLPIWACGGIGLHTAAACYAAGAAGVVLDAQLTLTRESQLPEATKAAIAAMDGSETVCLGGELGRIYRGYARPGLLAVEELRQVARALAQDPRPHAEVMAEWRQAVEARVGWGSSEEHVWPLGQDAAFAASLAQRHCTVGGVLKAMREAVSSHVSAACVLRPLDEGAPLARSHSTRYPIVQGPMTRVSDRAEFALRVAEGGALPFLALGLLQAPEASSLLEETRRSLRDRPWGVGILGFVPLDLRQEQMEVVRQYHPPFALIAGGRPDQARALEREGIPTYLHVPSPGLLRLFLEDGARRFVFEGRECGGHVGPRSSFVLWNTMVDVLLEELSAHEAADCHVLFAGGIHDALSASMVVALAAPLAERGMSVGVLLGTSYLFTREAVATGAILPGFQEKALRCQHTVLLMSGPGHAVRCVPTPYANLFEREKQRMQQEGRSSDEIRQTLEGMNVGRLRIAAKGITRHPRYGQDPEAPKFIPVSEEEQHGQGLYMIGQLAILRDRTCTVEELHHEIAIEGSRRLENLRPAVQPASASAPAAQPAEIAIIGMGCILPKAQDLQTYWENTLNKVDAITEIPKDRWDWELYYDPDRSARDKIYSKWGGFIGDVPFDPIEYGMPPNSLASIDPMQLLALRTARAALEDAGYLEKPFNRSRVSVILGASGGTGDLGAAYLLRSGLPLLFGDTASDIIARADSILPEWTEDSFGGLLLNVAAGRITNRFDFGGLNYVVDAACASSLTAVHLAVKELETHNTDMVITGGVDTVQNPFGYLCFSKTQALSPTGRARTFDADADGIVIGEGIVMLVLKRLADAERDGDRIYAVIQGIGGSSDGRAKGLTAPRPEGQVLALQRAYAKAGSSPTTVGLFEAHGTGTVVGDHTEALALSTFLEEAGATPQSCAVGSVKTMIGHTKATAGVAGLAKVALALYHKVLPPTLGVTHPNPKARFGEGPLYINSETRPWIHGVPDHPRRSGVSAFGFGGTNFHAVVEEYTGDFLPSRRAVLQRWPSELLLWSANSRQELVTALAPLVQALERGARPALCDLAFTLHERFITQRPASAVCLAIVTTSGDDLRQKLAQAREKFKSPGIIQTADPRGIYFSDRPLAQGGKIAFLFPGQGSQYPDMLRDLAIHFPEVRETFEQTDEVLAQWFPKPLSSYVFPPPAFTSEEQQVQRQALTQTNVAQPALGAADMALFGLLEGLGVRPDLLAGHSYGEYPALCAAGVIELETLAILSEARGRAIIEAAEDNLGTMVAVRADAETITPIVEPVAGVWIANLNAPKQTLISGTNEGIAEAVKRLEAEGINVRAIPVACAFHSPLVAPAQQRLAEALSCAHFTTPVVEVFSNTTAAPYPREPLTIRELLAEHLVHPIRFVDEIDAMYAAGARLFVEVGPRNVLTGLVGQILGEHPHLAIAVDLPRRSGLTQLQHALGQLAAHGVPLHLERLFQGRIARRLNLNALEEETGDKPLAPTTWLVNGGRARPLHQPTGVSPRSAISPTASPSALQPPSADQGDGSGRTESTRTERLSLPSAPVAVPTPVQTSQGSVVTPRQAREVEQVMLQYQHVMTRFLETQRNVMLAYLQGAPGAEAETLLASPHSQFEALPGPAPVSVVPERPSVSAIVGSGPLDVSTPDTSVPAPAAGTPPDRERLTHQLLQIVSERTGYPPEMLDLDVDIEADLGIDSIKRVEILGALQRACIPSDCQIGQEAMEQLTGIKTLGGVIDWIDDALQAGAEKPESRGAQGQRDTGTEPQGDREASAQTKVPRSTLVAADAPSVSNRSLQLTPDRVFLVSADGRGIAQAVAEHIRGRGGRVVLVQLGVGISAVDEGNYRVDLTDPAVVSEFVAMVRQQHGLIGGVIHLLPLQDRTDPAAMDLVTWRDRLCREVKSLFYLARTTAEDLKQAGEMEGAWLVAATAMGGTCAIDPTEQQSFFPGHGSIAGLVKTLALEWPTVRCKVVDLDLEDPVATLAEQLFQEIAAGDGLVEVGYKDARRRILQPKWVPLDPDAATELPIDSNWVVLVTGGARGIMAEVACELAEHYQPTLLLVGRSPMPQPEEAPRTARLTSPQELKAALMDQMRQGGEPVTLARVEAAYNRLLKDREMRRNLARMERTGAIVRYHQADVRDEQAMTRLIEGVYREYDRLDGVIHGAGVIEDKLIEDKTSGSFDRVFDTKVDGAFILSRVLRADSLRFLVLFSSAAGPFGNRGQCDYAAANEVLNKLAIYLDKIWPGRIVSINWGPWAKTGMVSPELQRQFAKRGVQLISIPAGRQIFERELRCGRKGEAEVIVAGGTREAINTGDQAAQSSGLTLPLLQQATILTRGDDVVQMVRTLDLSHDVYLRDHQLDGKPVLPLAMAMELMVEVGQQGWPDLEVVGLRDLQVFKGVILEDGPKNVRLVARARAGSSSGRPGVNVNVEITDSEGMAHPYYRAIVELADGLPEPPSYRPPSPDSLRPFPMSVDEAYRQWLFHGALFQGIAEIEGITDEGMTATLVSSSPQQCLIGTPEGRWLIDPVVFDSGLQLFVLWTRAYLDVTPLPSRFRRYRRFGSLSESQVRCHLHVLDGTQGRVFHINVAFVEPDGRLLGLLEDMESAGSKDLNRLAGGHL